MAASRLARTSRSKSEGQYPCKREVYEALADCDDELSTCYIPFVNRLATLVSPHCLSRIFFPAVLVFCSFSNPTMLFMFAVVFSPDPLRVFPKNAPRASFSSH